MGLDALDGVRQRYDQDTNTKSFKGIIYGDSGTGKTSIASTCRTPVLVHSFDPGGSKVLRPFVEKGDVIVDSSFEAEDAKNPTAFEAWDKEYHRLKKEKVFEELGTYVIDSLTTLSNAAMNLVLKKAGRTAGVPQQNDYMPQMTLLRNALHDILSLPCDILLICHTDVNKDEISGKIYRNIMVTGKLSTQIPLMFDEQYYACTKETSKGSEFWLQTKPDPSARAKTRIGGHIAKTPFEFLEKPDIKNLLDKAGLL